ncbi:serine protease inhibitor 42Dd-like isoform X2 [Condylostylus longicornis]|uniref:serine protease inhibitor 42Dd-like isoform X2 n=1 Tax=Condylostylus longicornis TaxID=2530218 RepID=UPI00244DBB17|nr:serine protease inhibitor 42Dd-like isoform X2 [Condylostylus longicornis]
MNNIRAIIILLIIGICHLSSTAKASVKSDFVTSNKNFALDFFQYLRNNPNNKDKNLIFSPISIQIAGGLLYAGAEGKTANEILKGFSLPGNDKESVNNVFSTFFNNNKNLLSSGNFYLANKIYVMNGFSLKPNYNEIATKYYHSDIENINFVDSINSAKSINDWVIEHTDGKIKDLVESDSFDLLTRMYIVNAVQFKGEWENKFDSSNTGIDDFYVTPSIKIPLEMMQKTGQIEAKNFYDISATGVNLKYKDSDLSFYILTTQNYDQPLSDLENKLDATFLSDLFEQTKDPISVQLKLPKFEFELTTDLKAALKELNVNTMFTSDADFTSILDTTEQLMVSDGVHKAYIKIDEEGTEASAASGISISSRMGPMTININHPFLYFIKTSDGKILFMGRFTGQ